METVSEWKKKRGSPPLSPSEVTSVGTGKISNLLTPKEEPTVQETPVAPQTGLIPVSEWKKSRPSTPVPTVPQVTMPKSEGNTIAENYKIYSEGLKKVAGAISSSLFETTGMSIEGMEWLGKKILRTAGADVSKLGGAGEAINNFFKDVARVNRPTDERFTRNLVEGTGLNISWNDILGMFGSMASFYAPAKFVQLSGGTGAAAGALANFTMTALESATEAGAVYDQLLANGVPEKEADIKANRTFILNVITNAILNKFAGYFDNDTETYLRSVIKGVLAEGTQESIQQVISNLNTGRPPFEGVPESGILGGLMGASTGAFSKLVGTGFTGKLPEKQKGETKTKKELVDVNAPAPTSAEEMQLRIEEESRRLANELNGGVNTNTVTDGQTPVISPENITSGFRGGPESNPPVGKTAQDIVRYEQVELGNTDVVPVPGIDLEKVKSENTLWLTRTRKQAERYGDEVQEVKGNFRVLAVDSEGGVLVEKLGQPEKKKPTAKQTRPKDIGKAYAPGSKRIAEIFDQSTEQKTVLNGKNTDFVLGAFGRSHQYRKLEEKKYDRFEESELPETLKRATEAFRASDDETNYRYDNIVWVSKMPNGELRAVYTRQNKAGQEEIIAWHKISKEKAEKYISILRSYGIPERNRTSNLSVRSGTLYPLGYGDKKIIQQKEGTTQEKRQPVKKEQKQKVQEISKKITNLYLESPVYGQALSYISTELEIAEVGIKQTDDGKYVRYSSYPKWIPEDMKKSGGVKKLFLKMMPLETGVSIPTAQNATKQRAALDVILGQIDAMTGIDTSKERQAVYDALGDNITAVVADTSNPIRIQEETGPQDPIAYFSRLSSVEKRAVSFGVLKDNPTIISKDEAIAIWKRYFPEKELEIEFVERLYDYMGDPVAGITLAQTTKVATGEGIALETISHEAVHRFLMTFVDEKSRKRYRDRAWQSLLREKSKEKDGIQNIQKQLRELNYTYRGRLKAEQLKGMLAEEYLADNFLKYLQKQEQISKMPFFRRLFEKARQFLLRLSPSSAERLYDDIVKVRRNLNNKRDFWQGLYFQAIKEKYKTTTKTLEFIKSQIKKDTVSKKTIEEYLNREGVTAMDKEIIKDTLDSIPGDTVNLNEFFAGAHARIMPLQVIRSTHWAEYGEGALASIKQEDRGENELKGKAESHVWDAPYSYEYHPKNIHWPELYRNDMPTPKREDFSIEHAVGEHEGLAQNIWVVVRKTSAQYQESDIVGTFGTKESAEAWLEDFIKNGANVKGTGLFGHTRVIYIPPKSVAKEWMREQLEPYRIKAQEEKDIVDKAEKFLEELKRRSDDFADVVMRENMAQPTTKEDGGLYKWWYKSDNIAGFLAEVARSVGLDNVDVSALKDLSERIIPVNSGEFLLHGRRVHPDKMWWMDKEQLDKGMRPLDPRSFLDPALYFKEKPEDRQIKIQGSEGTVDMKTSVRGVIFDHLKRLSIHTLKYTNVIPNTTALDEYERQKEKIQKIIDGATEEAQYLVVEVQGDPWQTRYPYISPWAIQKQTVKDYELLFKMIGEGLPVPEWVADKKNLESKIIDAIQKYNNRLLEREDISGPKAKEIKQLFLMSLRVIGDKIYLTRKVEYPNGAASELLKDISEATTKKIRDKISQYLAEEKEKLEKIEKTVTKEERQFVAMGSKFHERVLKEEIRLAAQIAQETGKPVKFRVATPFTISMIEGHIPNSSQYFVKDGVLFSPDIKQSEPRQLLKRDDFAPEDYALIKEKIDDYLERYKELTLDEKQEELDNENAFVLINGAPYKINLVSDGEYEFELLKKSSLYITPYETDETTLSQGDIVRYLGRDYMVVSVEGDTIKIAMADRVVIGYTDHELSFMVDNIIEDIHSSEEGKYLEKIVGSNMAKKWLKGELTINGVKLDKPDKLELQVILNEIAKKNDETATFEDVKDEVYDKLYELNEMTLEDDLQQRYGGGVFFDPYSTRFYGVEDDANLQEFFTPNMYDASSKDAIADINVSSPSEDKTEKKNARGEYAFDPEVLKSGSDGDRYYVYQYYDKVVIPWFIKYRKDAKLHTDERGLQSWETEIKPEDAGPVVAFQRLPNDPTNEQTNPIEFPELVRLATDLMGDYPKVPKKLKSKLERGNFRGVGSGEISLSPDIFDPENQVDGFQFARTLAHEIGHLIDWLPDKTLNRGNLLGRLASLRDFRKEILPDSPGIKNKAIRDEMYALSKKWRPFDETAVSESFLKYRKSGKEIYADFISALFNAPAMVRNDAPQAYKLFFQKLDEKPMVRDAYFGLQLQLRNMPDILKARREGVQEMFAKADYNSIVKQQLYEDEAEKRRKSLWDRFKYDYIDVTEPIREKVKAQKEKGVELNADERPDLLLEEYNYISGLIKGTIEDKFQPIFKTLSENGLTEIDLGEMMFYERILFGDRGTVANPGGLQPDFVKELYGDIGQVKADDKARDFSESMRTKLGDQKFNLLRSLAAQYRAAIKEIMLQGHKEGLYSDELAELMQKNAYYVPFRGARYSGDRMSFAVKHQIGTLGPIENPAITGLVKVVEVIRAIERNKAKRATIKLLERTGDVLPAKTIWNGRYNEPVDPQDRFLQLITIMDGGKVSGYYVDKYIAQAFERSSAQQLGLATSALRAINSVWYRPVFITFNLGFQSFNLVRDFMRYWKNIPGMTLIRAVQNYVKAARVAKVRTFGSSGSEKDLASMRELIKLEKERILGITMNDALMGREEEDTQLEHILKTYHVLPKTAGRFGRFSNTAVFGGLDKVLTMIENLGNFIETLPKVAGVYALEGTMKPEEMRSYVRRKIGSPDFLAGGRNKPVMNEIFLFSNAILQGIRADMEVATDPTTRAGYWYKTAQVNIAPKILMMMALAGLLGEELKKLFDKVSEYDLTNYTVIPLGTDQNGKVVYIRIPSDETGRFLGGIFWKGMKFATADADAWKTLTQILSYTGGQLPSVSPVIEGAVNTMQFLAGQNPYDFFRGRTILSDEEMAAGGTVAGKKFAAFLFEQMGGGIFLKLYTNEPFPREKSPGEAVFELPVVGNVINRWIKISNIGQYQSDREVINKLRQEEARTTIKQRNIMFDYLKQAIGKSGAEVAEIERNMIEEAVGKIDSKEKKEQADSLRRRFRLLRIRGEASTEIDMIASMRTNDEKAVLLNRYRSRMGQAEFDSMVRFLMANKIISSDVLRKMYGLEAQ